MYSFNLPASKARHRAALALIAAGLTCPVFGWVQESHNKELPLVWVLSTGGTIAGRGASSTSLTEYKSGSILGEELVSAVPEINQFAQVKVTQIVNVGSPDIKTKDPEEINRMFTEY